MMSQRLNLPDDTRLRARHIRDVTGEEKPNSILQFGRVSHAVMSDTTVAWGSHVHHATVRSSALRDWSGVFGKNALVLGSVLKDGALVFAPARAGGLAIANLVRLEEWDTIGPDARVFGGDDVVTVVKDEVSYTAYRAIMDKPLWEALMGIPYDCATCPTSATPCYYCPEPPWRIVSRVMRPASILAVYNHEDGVPDVVDLSPSLPEDVEHVIHSLIARRRKKRLHDTIVQDRIYL